MPDQVNRAELLEVVLVFNGNLDLSPGKMAGQAFRACQRARHAWARGCQLHHVLLWDVWVRDGTRTIVKVAKTWAMFDRIRAEVEPNYVMRDEGFTEVEAGAPTVIVLGPFLHRDRPKLLNSKKVPLL